MKGNHMNEFNLTERATLLVVDDMPEDLALMSSLLMDDYKVKVANGGEKALKIAVSDSPPDLILLDIMMPGMDGYEVCRRLKENKETKEIPVIFITAKSDIEGEAQGFDLGAVDYITKPFVHQIVLARVRTHLQLKRKTDLLEQALKEIKTLRGIVPICANCKKIRDDEGYWSQVEVYVQNHTEAKFSHGICPACAKKLYPEFDLGDGITPKKE
jgi:PleD family two-component response regulator